MRILVAALIILTMTCTGDPGARAGNPRTRVRLDAVAAIPFEGELIYGLGCLSHGCPEYFIARLEQASADVPRGFYALLTYLTPPGGRHPTRAELDRSRFWTVELQRRKSCDTSWAILSSRDTWKVFDPSTPTLLKGETLLPCFEIVYGAFEPAQE